MQNTSGLETLLDLDGSVIGQEGGYWIKIEARQVIVSEGIPHGIKYSLTLHDQYGKRLLGYDNAHAPKLPKKYKHAGRVVTYDHKHRHLHDKGFPYEFQDPAQLLTDFFADVDRKLAEEMQKK